MLHENIYPLMVMVVREGEEEEEGGMIGVERGIWMAGHIQRVTLIDAHLPLAPRSVLQVH